MNILDQLAAHARERTEEAKRKLPLVELRNRVQALPKKNRALEQAIGKPGISFICECKKASPSKGLIASDFPFLQIAGEYAEGNREKGFDPLPPEGLHG